MKSVLQLCINGENVEVLAPTHHSLLEVLREELCLTGTKHGCELGECGTCTVLIDGVDITFADITAAKTLEKQLRAKQAGLERRIGKQATQLARRRAS